MTVLPRKLQREMERLFTATDKLELPLERLHRPVTGSICGYAVVVLARTISGAL
jgi:hypothetical protein